MPRFLRCIGLLLLSLAFAVPAMPAEVKQAGDQKKDDKKDEKKDGKKTGGYTADPKAKAKEKPKPDWAVDFIGKLTALNEKDDGRANFTVQVKYQIPELDTGAQQRIVQHQQTLAQQQLQLARSKNLQERQNTLNQMANTAKQLEQAKAQLYKLKEMSFDVKCQATDNMRIRKYAPSLVLDPDTGEYVKMTKDLIKEAIGHEGYPGYKADYKILEKGQMVQVFLWKDSQTPAMLLDKTRKDKAKVDDIQNELKNFRYDVIMIYIMSDAPKGKG